MNFKFEVALCATGGGLVRDLFFFARLALCAIAVEIYLQATYKVPSYRTIELQSAKEPLSTAEDQHVVNRHCL